MATERQSPDALLVQDNLSGAVGDIQDDPDSPDANWLTASSNNANSVCRVSYPTPTGDPTTGAGLQEFKYWARLTPNGTTCAWDIYLYENGVVRNGGAAIASGTLSSTTGQMLTATWDASLLSTTDGSLVESELVVTKSGGSPANRTTGEVGAVEWNVTYTPGATYVYLIGSSAGAGATPAIPLSVIRGLIASSAGAATADGVIALLLGLAGSSAGAATADGALSVLLSLVGASPGQSTSFGSLSIAGATVGLIGSSAGQSAADGVVKVTLGLVGSSGGLSTTLGSIQLKLGLAGSIAGQSSADAVMQAVLGLSGSSDAFTTTFADLTIAGQISLYGNSAAWTSADGTVRIDLGLVGSAGGTSVIQGILSGIADAGSHMRNFALMRIQFKRQRIWMKMTRRRRR